MIYYPPYSIAGRDRKKMSVFLGGSIEMGKAELWQNQFIDNLTSANSPILGFKGAAAKKPLPSPFHIFNPRRSDWDSTWEQRIENPQFYQQVSWELLALSEADWIVMYFQPETQSPISLMEFGMYANSGRLLVCCPEGFWRKGNVDIVCHEFGIRQFETLEQIASFLIEQSKL